MRRTGGGRNVRGTARAEEEVGNAMTVDFRMPSDTPTPVPAAA